MRVLVWKSQGCIDVSQADTAVGLRAITYDVEAVMKNWGCVGLDRHISYIHRVLDGPFNGDPLKAVRSRLLSIVDEYGGDTDEFENFEFTDVTTGQ